MWRLTQARKAGPSLSRKKIANSVNETPKASEAIPRMPDATPLRSVEIASGTAAETLAFALPAADESTPTSCIQPWIVSAASFVNFEIWSP